MCFFLSIYACESTSDSSLNQSLAVASSFVFGYFSSFFQSKITGLAADISNKELIYFNFGTGIAGILSNLLSYTINKIFPIQYNDNDFAVLRQQVLANITVITIFFVLYFAIQYKFDKKNPEVLLFEGDREIENVLTEVSMVDTTRSMGEIKIIKNILDLLIAILFVYMYTILVVSLFNIQSFFAFDKNKTMLTIQIYSFFFNFFDTVGKFLPPQSLVQKTIVIHVLNICRASIPIYFIYTIYFSPESMLVSVYIRIAANILLGFSNGYFSNSLMTLATQRFGKRMEKAKAAYFSLLFLYIGIVTGAFINVLLTQKN
jgi:hypothetical protein